MTIQITKPEIEDLIARRLKSGGFESAEDLILQALRSFAPEGQLGAERGAAIERLKTFGRTHGLSLGGMTIRELRDASRP